jgi:two-component system OmpR family response regulator
MVIVFIAGGTPILAKRSARGNVAAQYTASAPHVSTSQACSKAKANWHAYRAWRMKDAPAAQVLIVEDDAPLASGLARALEQAGFAVAVRASGELALQVFAQSAYQLVVLDVGLPGIDGYEVLRRLRAGGHAVPVLMLTARDTPDGRARCLELGAQDYLAKPCALPEFAARVRAALRRAGAIMRSKMRILIVEDDAALGSGLGRILEADGYAVDVMPRGEQAVLAAQRERFDLVILNVGLPDIDGFEVLRRLRGGAQRMPVLVLTARDTVDDRVHGLDLGADDYMAKPFAMPELAARVRALIRRSQAQSGPRIVHGPLALDTVARRAFLGEAPLDLAAREWAVLEVLLARVERIVSKEAIIQAVASWGDELSPNAIEVYVSRLRAKLEPAGIHIRTVRGFGYMLEEHKEAH